MIRLVQEFREAPFEEVLCHCFHHPCFWALLPHWVSCGPSINFALVRNDGDGLFIRFLDIVALAHEAVVARNGRFSVVVLW